MAFPPIRTGVWYSELSPFHHTLFEPLNEGDAGVLKAGHAYEWSRREQLPFDGEGERFFSEGQVKLISPHPHEFQSFELLHPDHRVTTLTLY